MTLLRHQLHHGNQTDYLDIKQWASNLYRSKIGLQPVSFPCHSCCLRSWHLPVASNPWSHAMLAESILKHVATAANLRDKAHLRGSCQKFCKAAGPNGGRKQPGFPHRSVVDGLHYVSTSATRPPKHPTTAWVNTKNCQFWSIFGSHTRPVECPWHILALLDQVIDNLLTLDLLAASLKDLCPAGDVEDCGQEPWNPTRRSVMSGIFDAEEDLAEWLGELLPIQGLLRFEAQTLSRLLHGKLYSGKRTLGSRKSHGIFSLRYDLV